MSETGKNHQCGVNDLEITQDDKNQQVEKHTMKHNNVSWQQVMREGNHV